MITRDDVTSAYRLFLGREPENEEVVQAAVRDHPNLEQLRQAFLRSDEFRPQFESAVLASRFPHDLDAGSNRIDVECGPEALRELLSRVEHTWTTLGDRDPYWSVLTDDAFKLGNVEKNEDLFWGSGKHDVLRMCRWMQRNGIHRPGARCLEYGCGMGRMSGWLVQEFGSLIACDISEAHLRLARRAASLRGDRGIQFLRISKLTDLDELPPFDILFSIIVLQHNPPPVIAYLIDRLLHRLEPGGIAYFQVPTFQAGYRFSVEEYLAPDSGCGQSMEMHALPQRNVFQIAARNGCEAIEVSPDNMTGSLDFVSTTFLLRKR